MIERIEHDDVEGIRVGRFTSRINTTCIVYRVGETVVDTGPPNQWRRVRRFLEERAVRRVVVTHHHEDHSGNLASIHDALGASVHAPADGLAPLRDGFALQPYRRVIWGRPGRVAPEQLPTTIEIAPGRVLRPVPCPGHSTDMTCYLDVERGRLFTGDLFISQRTRYLRVDEDLRAHMASLRRVLELDFDTLLCSHRGVVAEGKAELRGKLEFLERLCGEARRLCDEGRGEGEITRLLLGREDFMSWLTLFHFCKRNLIRACLAAGNAAGETA